MKRSDLKELLITIKENDFKVPKNINPFDLSLVMMDYIGDVDSELRDKLMFTTFWKWIMNDVLTTEEIYKILEVSLDEKHLLYGLGELNDSVFTRTFSVLIVALAVYKHRDNSYLSKEDLESILDKVTKFYEEDRDVRGYIEGKGWAHGAAHGADALDELARCEEFGSRELKRILDAIYKKININYYSYVHQEDERIVTAVEAIFEREAIDDTEIIGWIKSFSDIEQIDKYPEDMIINVNVKNFLRSLYFRLIKKSEYDRFSNVTKEVLQSISEF